MLLALPEVDVRKFEWLGNGGMAELSELMGVDVFSRIFSDAADCGFKLVNPRTRVEKVMVFDSVEKVNGEIGSWTFKAMDGSVFVEIFND